ncbi:MAG: alpha/beta fold hydrolase [Rhodanobacteraceae bacterium]|jgi:pimeloyl-ACP methyl ester carboxylesterase|nr:alpha/beta fold hydrolase [Rhodanobacteraceae bacterium]
MAEHVILLHGIWMRGVTLWPLARRLHAAGYTVETPDYASVSGGLAAAAARLRERLRTAGGAPVHLVGHSLGGLVALEAVRDQVDLVDGRIVCLGSPLNGSAAARGLAHWPGGHWLLGQSAQALQDGIAPWHGPRQVGVIAGQLPLGLGFAFAHLAPPHDGTVAVEETCLPGIADHRTVHASHTGLLLSAAAADLTLAFLRAGRFPGDAQAAR